MQSTSFGALLLFAVAFRVVYGQNCQGLCIAAAMGRPTPIRNAAANRKLDVCSCFCSNTGGTLLRESTFSSPPCVNCAVELIKADCRVDAVSGNRDNTPLLDAAEIAAESMVEYLLGQGNVMPSPNPIANPNFVNLEGDTAICLAALGTDASYVNVVISLANAGADFCITCSDNILPFDRATNPAVQTAIGNNGGLPAPSGGPC